MSFLPSSNVNLEQILKLVSEGYNVIPIYKNYIADLDTPVSLYIKSGAWQKDYSFLLESVTGGESRGRYSYISLDHSFKITGKNSIFQTENKHGKVEILKATDPFYALQEVMLKYKAYQPIDLSGFYAGAVGFFPYDVARYYENLNNTNHSIELTKKDPLNLPDILYVLPSFMLWFDHTQCMAKIIYNLFIDAEDSIEIIKEKYKQAHIDIDFCLETMKSNEQLQQYTQLKRPLPQDSLNWNCNFTDDEFKTIVERTKEYIRAGDIFQGVLSKRFFREYNYDSFFLYRALRVTNPSPYMFYLNFPDIKLIGSSPEILVKKEDNQVLVRPIAGTIKRGKNNHEDVILGQQLLSDIKEIAEHTMLVDLGRNDIGRVCEYGTVKVDELMTIEKYSHVMHIVSNVIGTLSKNKTAFDCLCATFPAGTVSGAPKVRAMQIINELEKEVRGTYAGCIGLITFDGNMDMAITLRTMTVKNEILYIQAGAGIVFDSIPENENQEVYNKLKALFSAVDLFYSGKLEVM